MKRKLLIALAVAGLLSAAVGPTTLPAGAAAHVVTVKLLNGQLLTYQLPDGAPCDTSALPNVPAGAVVVGCQEVATPTTPAAPASAKASAVDSPIPAAAPVISATLPLKSSGLRITKFLSKCRMSYGSTS